MVKESTLIVHLGILRFPDFLKTQLSFLQTGYLVSRYSVGESYYPCVRYFFSVVAKIDEATIYIESSHYENLSAILKTAIEKFDKASDCRYRFEIVKVIRL